jgi:hypothetical protein
MPAKWPGNTRHVGGAGLDLEARWLGPRRRETIDWALVVVKAACEAGQAQPLMMECQPALTVLGPTAVTGCLAAWQQAHEVHTVRAILSDNSLGMTQGIQASGQNSSTRMTTAAGSSSCVIS